MSRYRRSQAQGATFFFTVTLADRRSSMLVTQIERLRAVYASVRRESPFKTIAICVLPDHLHALWQLPVGDADFSSRWNQIKGGFSRALPTGPLSASKLRKREKGIWQRRFWEHQIRDEADLRKHADYIHFNPVKHGHVARVTDWAHSSFHAYVKAGWLEADWGGTMDDGENRGEPR